jgi:hypothetical protein
LAIARHSPANFRNFSEGLIGQFSLCRIAVISNVRLHFGEAPTGRRLHRVPQPSRSNFEVIDDMGFGVLDDLPGRPGSGGVVTRRSSAGRRLRDLERPSNLTGGAAGRVAAKLLTAEEIQSRGSCVASRRGRCATLRITKRGLQAIPVRRRDDRGRGRRTAKETDRSRPCAWFCA